MPRRERCSRCAKRLPEGAHRCVTCGGSPRRVEPSDARGWAIVGFAALALLTVLAVGFSDRYVPAVADWYSRMVIHYLPDSAARFAPVPDDRAAFYVCARSVARQVEDAESIVTFVADEGDAPLPVGGALYRLESHFEEALLDGTTQRRSFACTLRLENGDWRLEEIELQPPPTPIAIR